MHEMPARDAAVLSHSGRSSPLGATISPGGVNFCVFSRQATRIELLLFENAEAAQPAHVIDLDPRMHRTYHYWHVFVPGIGAGQIYAYRAFGPFDRRQGLRFDPSKALLDPYGRAVVVPEAYSRQRASQYGQSDANAMKSVVADPALTIGKAMRRCVGVLRPPSSTRCTSPASRVTPARGSPPGSEGHTRE